MCLRIIMIYPLYLTIIPAVGPGYRATIHKAKAGLKETRIRGPCTIAFEVLLHLSPVSFLFSKWKKGPDLMFRTWQRAKNAPSPSLVKLEKCQYQRQHLNTRQNSVGNPRVGFLCGDHTVERGWGDLSIWSKGTPDVSGWAQGRLRNGRTGLPPVAPLNSLSDDQSSSHREQIFSGSQKFETWKEDRQIPPLIEVAHYRMGREANYFYSGNSMWAC